MKSADRDPRRKLTLERRTLRTLDARDLRRVAGGAKPAGDGDADGDYSLAIGGIDVSRGRGTV